ncbi:MAG: PAS domain-containing protein [Azospirillum sp.]|nr:PAS domain-containing protein [Azospirillum sp.]
MNSAIRNEIENTPEIDDRSPDKALHPNILAVLHYWNGKKKDRHPPFRSDIDPCEIPRFLPGIWLLDVETAPFRLRYRLVGTNIVDAIGDDPTGRYLDEAHPHIRQIDGFFDRYRKALETGIPSRRRGTAVLWRNDDFRDIENIVLPLRNAESSGHIIMVKTVLFRWDGSNPKTPGVLRNVDFRERIREA